MTELQYIRTDRNGTKIYHDWTCPRCGGAGRSDNWWRTGYTCHECGGSGKRRTPKVVKEYTPEYEAKLTARRLAKMPPQPDEAELRARAEEAMRVMNRSEGFAPDGIGFIYAGDTYKHKEAFRAIGGKWNYNLHAWIVPAKIDDLQGVRVTEVNARDLRNKYGCLDPDKLWELQERI